jgi:aminoglycoside phosphotransferase (APT) family kinase protein
MGDLLPWRSDRPLDAALVERVVDARFPGLRPAKATFVDQGWDSEVYAVGEWILRFPKRAEVAASHATERRLLPRLAPRLPVPIPHLELVGEAGADFPFPFLGYRRLPGVAAVGLAPEAVDQRAVAKRMAEVVSALHAISPEEAGEVPTHQPRDAEQSRRAYLERWVAARHAVPAPLAERGDAFLGATAPPTHPFPLRLTHCDVTYDHVLLTPDGRDVSGIIDWGDVGFADPAWDFAGMLAWFGEDFLARMLDGYRLPTDPELLERIRRGAVYASISALWWGLDGHRPRDTAAGLRGLELALPRV